jgi:hypothetical protein
MARLNNTGRQQLFNSEEQNNGFAERLDEMECLRRFNQTGVTIVEMCKDHENDLLFDKQRHFPPFPSP